MMETTDIIYIYALRESGESHIRYVGQTIDPKMRLWGHINKGDINSSGLKEAWIGSVLSQGKKIEMDIVETCAPSQAGAREAYWMNYYRQNGHLLTNAGPAQRRLSRARRTYTVCKSAPAEDHDDLENLSDEEWGEMEKKMDRIGRMLLLIAEKLGIYVEDTHNAPHS